MCTPSGLSVRATELQKHSYGGGPWPESLKAHLCCECVSECWRACASLVSVRVCACLCVSVRVCACGCACGCLLVFVFALVLVLRLLLLLLLPSVSASASASASVCGCVLLLVKARQTSWALLGGRLCLWRATHKHTKANPTCEQLHVDPK